MSKILPPDSTAGLTHISQVHVLHHDDDDDDERFSPAAALVVGSRGK